jgi:phospholipid/cholesterol/gamma-HCH transport system substrate-binding protein
MNERVMQFRIGMFVIVAGLVLTMLIVWFGESPLILRDHVFLTVHYVEAPGVAEGTPVRKSGIRIGEVAAISIEERPNHPDGVYVTLSLDRKYPLKAGTVPRLTRSLIGDVTIDMLPGTGPALITTGETSDGAPVIEGAVAPDPARALEAATLAFTQAGDTLKAIDEAASGLARISRSADKLDEFLITWTSSGHSVGDAAHRVDQFIASNEGSVQPALEKLREAVERFNTTFDPKTQDELKTGINRFASVSARLDSGVADALPFLQDLGLPTTSKPRTDFGQFLRRLNLITSDVGLLTQTLNNGRGALNGDGTIQKLLTRGELYDNINKMAGTTNDTFSRVGQVIALLKIFAEKVSRDPGVLSRGALQR